MNQKTFILIIIFFVIGLVVGGATTWFWQELKSQTESSFQGQPYVPSFSITGYLEKLGPNIYMQGTHKLTGIDGKESYILKSTAHDLSLYEGKTVQVRGDIQQTVTGEAIIIEVQDISVIEDKQGIPIAPEQPSYNKPQSESARPQTGATSASLKKQVISQTWVADGVIEGRVGILNLLYNKLPLPRPSASFYLRLRDGSRITLVAGLANPADFNEKIVRVKGEIVKNSFKELVIKTNQIKLLAEVIQGVFTIRVFDETFNNPFQDKEKALKLYFGLIDPLIPFGTVVDDRPNTSPYDSQWHWHLQSGKFVELVMEVCDGTPSGVERNITEWIIKYKVYCPWAGIVDGYR